MNLLISCPFGLSSILNKELKFMDIQSYNTFERGTFVQVESLESIYEINIKSRIANKVYLELASGEINNFDNLFDLAFSVNRRDYISDGQNIIIKTNSRNSMLSSPKTIQSISNKAIFKKLCGDSDRKIDNKKEEVEIFIDLENDTGKIFINTSGDALFKRGYKRQETEAPIKENLAAGLIFMAGRKFKEVLCDPFCGSGTILIEAAMIAKNIAPGLRRNFAFQNFKNYQKDTFDALIQRAKSQIFEKNNYKLIGYDINNEAIEIAKQNARNAGVSEIIDFQAKSFTPRREPGVGTWIITNPPYGKRMGEEEELETIYKDLINIFELNSIKGGFITNRLTLRARKDQRSKKLLYNGQEECDFYKRMPALATNNTNNSDD